MKKKRAICFRCKAKKYLRYLKQVNFGEFVADWHWVCKNPSKCLKRGANYKK